MRKFQGLQSFKKRSPWLWVPSLSFGDALPNVVVMAISVILYKQLGLSNTAITFYTSWLYLPWILKPVWAPFIDLIKTKRWWIVSMEILLGAALGGIAFTIPTSFWLQGTLFFFWIIAFTGASHCVAADGFYMLGLDHPQQAWFIGVRSIAERLATIFGQGFLVMMAGNVQVLFRGSISYSWSLIFYGMAGLFLAIWLWHGTVLPRPADDVQRQYVSAHSVWLGFLDTFKTFFKKERILTILFFILFFRMPEAFLSKVTELFLIDTQQDGGLGLSPQEFGLVQGTVGAIGVSLGGLLGGFVVSRGGLKRWLWPMTAAYTLPALVYVFMGYELPSSLMIINSCVFFEQFGYGFGLTAYMLYLIYISRGDYQTSHYSIVSALMSLSMMLPGLFAGALQEAMGYRYFFVFVLICSPISFLVVSALHLDDNFGRQEDY